MLEKDKVLAYTLLRLTMGVNMLGHGIVRIPKIFGFRDWMLEVFSSSLLPDFLVDLFGLSLPFLELGLGVLLVLGLFTRQALHFGALLILALIFGSCLVEKWDWVAFQMIYALFYFTLSLFIDLNQISLDNQILKKTKGNL